MLLELIAEVPPVTCISRVVPAGRSVLPVKSTVPPLLGREVVEAVMVMNGAAP